MNVSFETLQQENDKQKQDSKDVRKRFETLQQENDKLRQDSKDVRKRFETLQQENDKQKQETLQQENDKLTQETLQQENDKLRQDSKDVRKRFETLQQENDKQKQETFQQENDKLTQEWREIRKATEPAYATWWRSYKHQVLEKYVREEYFPHIPQERIGTTQTVAVTLDPDTAHPCLIVSKDGKCVRKETTKQNVPDTEQRFDEYYFVLGRQGFTSGRHYWEVDVGDRDSWKLGVTYESATRKGRFDLSPSEGYWVIQLRSGGGLCALNVSLLKNPEKVGVYLDYEGGKVSFYRVEDRFHIYTFSFEFSEKLYPFFDPGTSGMDLVISL
ncbi:UNVERIFIED_CONTAM: hypothetical protein FKN15_044106 [Acipenser sinensis]